MASKAYLHVGTPKSGTTYVQAILAANKAELARREGLLFPGHRWADQVDAARDVLSFDPHGESSASVAGAWGRLVDEIAGWHGAAVVSMEWLGSVDLPRARRMVESLAPAQVEVVLTVRDLGRTIPAAWQEFVQNWEIWSWEEFLESVGEEDRFSTAAGRLFWTQQDLGRMLSVWTQLLPAEQIHVVTLPPAGQDPGALATRFGQVLGVDMARYDTKGGGRNESLGLESTLLVHRLNLLSREQQMSWSVYDREIKQRLCKRGLSQRKAREHALAVPEEHRTWVSARAQDQVASIRAAGVNVIGDLDDLAPVYAAGVQPSDIPVEAILEAALHGLAFDARSHAGTRAKLRAGAAPAVGATPGPDAGPGVKGRLVRASERSAAVMAARRAYVRGRDWLGRKG